MATPHPDRLDTPQLAVWPGRILLCQLLARLLAPNRPRRVGRWGLSCLLVGTLLVPVVEANEALPAAPSGVLAPAGQGGPPQVQPLARVLVKQFRFEGRTIIPEAELRQLVAPYEGRSITHQELEGLRQAISAYYVQQGYLNSGVLLNDQQVKEGVITFTVIEGNLTTIGINNNRSFRTSYLQQRIARGAVSPLNVNALQRNLQLLQQDPWLKKINAELRPGLELGEGVLDVTVEERSPFRARMTVDNGKSPAIGDVHGEFTLERHNLLGIGDSLQGSYGLTDGESSDYAISGTVPLNAADTTVKVHTSRTESVLVEEPFSDLDIRNQSTLWRLGVNHPLWREPSGEFRLGLALDLLENETFLQGAPTAFFDGTDDGRSALTIWRFSQEYVKRGPSRVMALASSFNQGENRTIEDDLGLLVDKRFFCWIGQGKLVTMHRFLERETQAVLRTDFQLTRHALLPSERFSVGGMNSVRGLRENSFMRDNGVLGSLEVRIPLAESVREGELTVRLVPFLDVATAWNNQPGERLRKEVVSPGLGLLITKQEWLEVRLFYGVPLEGRDTSGNSWQDHGVHFQMNLSL